MGAHFTDFCGYDGLRLTDSKWMPSGYLTDNTARNRHSNGYNGFDFASSVRTFRLCSAATASVRV
jgi:hypothetical protein